MKVSLTISVLAVALAAAPLAWAAAAPGVRLVSPPHVFQPWHGGERHAFWRNGDGDRDFGRRHRRDFIGPVAPVFGEAAEPGPDEAPSPLFLSAPVFIDITLAPGAGPAPVESVGGPKIIEIGQSAPPRRPLPLVIYGD
jgi:hypothetical protein